MLLEASSTHLALVMISLEEYNTLIGASRLALGELKCIAEWTAMQKPKHQC